MYFDNQSDLIRYLPWACVEPELMIAIIIVIYIIIGNLYMWINLLD